MAIGQIISAGMSPEQEIGIDSAVCLERKTVRVRFLDPPKAVLATASDDALNPDNWTVVPDGTAIFIGGNPSYTTLEVVLCKVVRDDPYSIDVVLDDDFSFDLLYIVTVSDSVILGDDPGGWTIHGSKVVNFLPFDPGCRQKPVQKVFDWFGRAAARFDVSGDMTLFVSLLQDLLEQVKFLIDCFPEQYNPLYCREDFLDSRMFSLGNPFELVTSEMSLPDKRKVALQLVDIYRQKGTNLGIITAIENILGISDVQVLASNENTWRIGLTGVELELPGPVPTSYVAFLGNGAALDPYWSGNFAFTGTMFLGATPTYEQVGLHDGSAITDNSQIAIIGRWNLADEFNVPYLWNPADHFTHLPETTLETDLGIVEELGRKELYYYRIILPATLTPTTAQLNQVTAIAKFMQKATMHLIGIS